jgi:hypothetical protein
LQRQGSGNQFGKDILENGRIENVSGLAQGAERNLANAEKFLDFLQLGDLLESAEAGDNAVEEVNEQEADVLIAKELPVASAIAFGRDVAQGFQEGQNEGEILEPLQLTLGNSRPWFGCQGRDSRNTSPVNEQYIASAHSMRRDSEKRKLRFYEAAYGKTGAERY